MAGDAGVIPAGLNVIRLVGDGGISYLYENLDAMNPCYLNDGGLGLCPQPTTPLGQEPDSAAVDVNTGLAIFPDESSGTQFILDLSKAVFDDQAFTVTAPVSSKVTFTFNNLLCAVAIESSTHLALWEEEGGSGIAVGNVNDVYNNGTMPVTGLIPSVPAGAGWSNLLDPHGVAVTTGIQNGNPVGFVVDDDSLSGSLGNGVWVARIDLQKVLSLGSSADISSAIDFLDARTKE
jgi:hypothetical protein